MMGNIPFKVPAPEIMRDVTMQVQVTGVRRTLFRMRLCIALLWLAYKVAGFGDFVLTWEEDESGE